MSRVRIGALSGVFRLGGVVGSYVFWESFYRLFCEERM